MLVVCQTALALERVAASYELLLAGPDCICTLCNCCHILYTHENSYVACDIFIHQFRAYSKSYLLPAQSNDRRLLRHPGSYRPGVQNHGTSEPPSLNIPPPMTAPIPPTQNHLPALILQNG